LFPLGCNKDVNASKEQLLFLLSSLSLFVVVACIFGGLTNRDKSLQNEEEYEEATNERQNTEDDKEDTTTK
jgi:hypothetical protein